MIRHEKIAKTVFLISLAVALTACGNSKDASKSNFSKSIQAYLDTRPGLCADLPADKLPFAIKTQDSGYTRNIQTANTLVDAGLLSKKEIEIKEDFGKKMVPAIEYQITEMGQKYLNNSSGLFFRVGSFCSGKYLISEIENFTEPSSMVGMTISRVKYRYNVENLDDWAKSENFQKTFPDFDPKNHKNIRGSAALILTNEGWVHERLFSKK